ncbi:unnamed protein product [Blepharisma stoltei]|uniref:SYO1-like TPR repeats domain-containing protein n=1 Tax=Blepharisma stoltei TaxID=1481888 RepID=A0AAU9IPZ1_9CILI|nr:unnamed protein product [Blepharisma stoltei]
MVKSKPSRNKNFRFDPLKSENFPAESDLKGYLRSTSEREREIGCIAVANMKSIPDISYVKLIVERISDASLSVQLSALQAAISLTQEYSGDLLRLGVLNLIDPIINQYFLVDPILPNSKQEEQLIITIVQTTLYLLESLCQENETFIQSLQNSPIIQECINKIIAKNASYISPCLDLLNAFSEENAQACDLIGTFFNNLYSLVTDGDLTPDNKMNIVLLISNFCIVKNQTQLLGEYVIFPCGKSLQVDVYSDLMNHVIPVINEENNGNALEIWNNGVKAQEISLEIITNLLAVEDEEVPIGNQFMNNALINDIMRAANGFTQEFGQNLEAFPEILSKVFELQCAAFYCVQNLVLNTDHLVQTVGAQNFWDFLFGQIRKIADFIEEDVDCKENVEELLDIISQVLLCFGKKYGNAFANKVSYIQEICTLINQLPIPIASNLIAALSVCAQEELTVDQARMIVNTLLFCATKGDMNMKCEVLNAFFDIFNDERYDSVLIELRVIGLMKSGSNLVFRHAAKLEDEELKERCGEALENLVEFIKYKEAHGVN